MVTVPTGAVMKVAVLTVALRTIAVLKVALVTLVVLTVVALIKEWRGQGARVAMISVGVILAPAPSAGNVVLALSESHPHSTTISLRQHFGERGA